MKRFFLILLIVVVVLAGAFAGYKFWEFRQDVALVDIIPAGAIAKLEGADFYNTFNTIEKKNALNEAIFIKDINNRIQALDSLFGKNQFGIIAGNKIASAVFYSTDKSNYDFLFIIPASEADKGLFDKLLAKVSAPPNALDKRKLEGIEIYQIKKGASHYCFVKFRNYLVSSTSPILIENFVRHIAEMQSWLSLPKPPAVQFTKPGGLANLRLKLYYHDLHQISSLCGDSSYSNFIKTFADSSELKLELKEGQAVLSGITTAGKNDFLYLFKGQKAKPLAIENYIPGNTAVFHYWSFEDGTNFERTLENYWKRNNSDQLTKWEKIKVDYLIDLKDYITGLNDELGYVKLEEKGELLLLKISDPERMFLETNRLVTLFKKDKASDSLYSGSYKSIRIRQMNYENFPSLLLGGFFEGFTTSYYGIIDDYLVFASDLKQLKNLIDDIDLENVWGKTLKMRAYLEENCSASNYITIINVPKAHSYLDSGMVNCPFTGFLKQADIASLQYTWINDKIYTRFGLKYHEDKAASMPDSANFVVEDIIALPTTINSKPYCYKSNSTLTTIVQDSLFNLNLIAKNKVEWSYPLGSMLVDLALADLDRNGKNDIVFATKDSVFAITALKGDNVPGFPVALPDKAIAAQFSVIDYNKDKNFRILVADSKGEVYMYDGKGRLLEGWKPNKLTKKVVAPIKHIRIGDKDILLAQLEDGTIDAFNRRGEMYDNFPVGDKTQCASPLFIDEGVNFNKTTITSLSTKGELSVYNLNGELLKEEQIVATPKDKFILRTDKQNRSFVIMQMSKEKNVIFNSKLEQIYENYFENKNQTVSYYNFGRGKEYIVLYNATDKETYLLNIKGKVLASGIKSSSVPYLMYDSEDEDIELINTESNILNKIIVEDI